MRQKITPKATLEIAKLTDYPMVQNMARFYVYDLSKTCGHLSDAWHLPSDGLFESFDFKSYFTEDTRRAYLIKVNGAVAGFVLINQETQRTPGQWNMGEFFILGQYQNKGIGHNVAKQIWQRHPGKWEVAVIPENKTALVFWEKAIQTLTQGAFSKETVHVDFDQDQPQRILFSFCSHAK